MLLKKKHKAVLLISDGEDHDQGATRAATDLVNSGTAVFTVGIGSTTGARIFDPIKNQFKVDKNGRDVITILNEQELEGIAQAGGGRYIFFTNIENTKKNIIDAINKLEKKDIKRIDYSSAKHYYQVFALLAVLLLLIELCLSDYKASKKMKWNIKWWGFALLLLSMASPLQAQKKTLLIEKGNDLYKMQNFDSAIKKYQQAQQSEPNPNALLNYNLANAYFKNKQIDQAQEAYNKAQAAAQDPSFLSKTNYNKGVLYSSQQKWQEAVDANKAALVLNPNDEEARENLQKALNELKKKSPKNKQKKSDKDKKDNKPQNNKKPDNKPAEPKKSNANMDKEKLEKMLSTLAQEEKQIQKKIKTNSKQPTTKVDKDW